MQQADLDADTVVVRDMNNMVNVFDISGQGSMATLQMIQIVNNDLTQVMPPTRFVAFNVRSDAMASVTNATISGNTNVRHVFSADANAFLEADIIMVSGNSGGNAIVRHLNKRSPCLGSSLC